MSDTTSQEPSPLPKSKIDGMRAIQRTSVQCQQERTNKKLTREVRKKAHKEAAILYEKEKGIENGMSAAQVAEYINDKYGTAINKRSKQWYVKEGRAGESPDRMGPDGGVSRAIFPILA